MFIFLLKSNQELYPTSEKKDLNFMIKFWLFILLKIKIIYLIGFDLSFPNDFFYHNWNIKIFNRIFEIFLDCYYINFELSLTITIIALLLGALAVF